YRRGAILQQEYPEVFPQSFPLDRIVQTTLVPALGANPSHRTLPGARWVGWLASIALTVLAARMAGAWRGTPRRPGVAATACVAMTGLRCVFTGYARDVVEALPLVLLLLLGLRQRIPAGARPSPVPEIALSALLWLHRASLGLVPAYLVATLGGSRAA